MSICIADSGDSGVVAGVVGTPLTGKESTPTWKKVVVATLVLLATMGFIVGGASLISTGTTAGFIGGGTLACAALLPALCLNYYIRKRDLYSWETLEVPCRTHVLKGEDVHLAIRYSGKEGEFDLMAVFDGHGDKGKIAGFVKAELPETFQRHYNTHRGDVAVAFREAFCELDERAKEKVKKERLEEGAGTTAVVTFVNRQTGKATVATLGDSEAMVLTWGGELRSLSPVIDWNCPEERARIGVTHSIEGGRRYESAHAKDTERLLVVPGAEHLHAKTSLTFPVGKGYQRTNFSRGIGHGGRTGEMISPIPDIREYQLAGADMIVLCSDGLGDHLTRPDDRASYARRIRDKSAAEVLTASMRFIGTKEEKPHDDVTVMAYSL